MDKKSFKKKHSLKDSDLSYKEQFETLNEKYTMIKEILKQVLKELTEEKEKGQLLLVECQKLASEVKEKDALLEHMQSVSEAVIDEYTALKVKCDLETEAASNASKRATKYFQENQLLKSSHGDIGNDLEKNPNVLCTQDCYLDESVSELDVLNKLASEMRSEVATLKLQLTKEIEKQSSLKEDFQIAKNLYEEEMKEHNSVKERLQALQLKYDKEISSATDECGGLDQTHPITIISKQDQGSSSEEVNSALCDSCVMSSSLKEKLQFSEQEISSYKQKSSDLLNRVKELESQLRKLNAEVSATELLPIPPPPPPPPPSFNPIRSLITFIHAGKKSTKSVKKESLENPQQKALSELIDTIKKGNIQLKPTPKIVPNASEKFSEEAALGEMKNILGTLKKKKSCVYEDINTKNDARNSVKMENICTARASQEVDESFNFGADIDEELKILLRKRTIKTIASIDGDCDYVPTTCADAAPIPLCDFVLNDKNQIGEDITTSYQIGVEDILLCSSVLEEKKSTNDSNLMEEPVLHDVLLHNSINTVENPTIKECIFKNQMENNDVLAPNSSIMEEKQISNSVSIFDKLECIATPLHNVVEENKISIDSFPLKNSNVCTSIQDTGIDEEKNNITDTTVVKIAVVNSDKQEESQCESCN